MLFVLFECSYLRGFFVCLLGDLGANSVRLACCPARDVQAHLALQYLSNTLIGLLSVCRSKQVLPPGALAHQACAEVHKDPFTFSTLLEAQAPGDPCALLHACIHASAALCVCGVYLGPWRGNWKRTHPVDFFPEQNTSQPQSQSRCVCV